MALTHEQCEKATQVSRQIMTTADTIRILAIQARDGTIDSIVLTPEQVEQMISKYLEGKAVLVKLFNQLPG